MALTVISDLDHVVDAVDGVNQLVCEAGAILFSSILFDVVDLFFLVGLTHNVMQKCIMVASAHAASV